FFLQAEDGIPDFHVTGVQTCALPISSGAKQTILTLKLKTVDMPTKFRVAHLRDGVLTARWSGRSLYTTIGSTLAANTPLPTFNAEMNESVTHELPPKLSTT